MAIYGTMKRRTLVLLKIEQLQFLAPMSFGMTNLNLASPHWQCGKV